jgi:hypothetical protein
MYDRLKVPPGAVLVSAPDLRRAAGPGFITNLGVYPPHPLSILGMDQLEPVPAQPFF